MKRFFLLCGCLLPSCAFFSNEVASVQTLDEKGSGAWLALASRSENQGQWKEAGVYLDKFLGSRAPSVSWLRRRIHAAKMAEDWSRCIESQVDLLNREPENFDVRVSLADNLQRVGRGREGVLYMQHEMNHPVNREACLRVILLLHERDNRLIDAARTAELLASDKSLEDFRLLLQRASLLREEAGDMRGAVRSMELALEGVDLNENESRLLSRIRATEVGVIASVDDALAILRYHKSEDFRYRAIVYLSDVNKRVETNLFSEFFEDSDARVILVAMKELFERGGQEYVVDFIPLCSHPDRSVRLLALEIIGAIGDFPEMLPVLESMDPSDRELFRVARRSLESIAQKDFGFSLDPSLKERHEIALAWRQWILSNSP